MNSNKTVIHYEGAEVWCYGPMAVDANVSVVCDDEGFDGIYANDAECSTWTQVVAELGPWAKRNGTTLEELTAI